MSGPSQAAVNQIAKSVDKQFAKIDKDNSGTISFEEFKNLKMPSQNSEASKKEIFNKLAASEKENSSEITKDSLSAVVENAPELIGERLSRVHNRLMSDQAQASEKTIDLYLAIRGKTDNLKLFTTAKNVVAEAFAKNMNSNSADPKVIEAVEKSSILQETTVELRNDYFAQQEKIFKNIPVSDVKKMIDVAVKNKDFDSLEALDFSITRFSGNRKDLAESRNLIAPQLEKLRPENAEPPLLGKMTFDLHAINEIQCMMGEAFLKAAKNAGIPLDEKKFLAAESFSNASAVKAAELKTAGVAADKLKKELFFDKNFRKEVSDLASKYESATLEVIKKASAENLIKINEKLHAASPENASSIFENQIGASGISKEHASSLVVQATEKGHRADHFSEEAGDRVLAVVSDYIEALSASSKK